MPRTKEFLLEQIARAQRFARAMNTDVDRERFEKIATDLRSELDMLEAGPVTPAAPTSGDAIATGEAALPRLPVD